MGNNDKEYLEEYRNHLQDIYQKAQEDYDKTVLTLSSGALGISFAFVKDIIGPGPISCSGLLYWSWVCWGVSVACVLFSHLTSSYSIRKSIEQVDKGEAYTQRIGGWYDKVTSVLNHLSGFLFLAGLVLIILFVSKNMV